VQRIIGFADSRGRGDIAAAHLAQVNRWSIDRTIDYIKQCFKIWQRRSQFE
jgi:hypothetical protein